MSGLILLLYSKFTRLISEQHDGQTISMVAGVLGGNWCSDVMLHLLQPPTLPILLLSLSVPTWCDDFLLLIGVFHYISTFTAWSPLYVIKQLWSTADGAHITPMVQGDRVSNIREALKLLPAHGIEVRLHPAITALLAIVF